MRLSKTLVLVVTLGATVGEALAQQPPAAEPAALTLPMGSRVRLQTAGAPGHWVKGVLVSADSAAVAMVPEDAPPLGANQLRVPSASLARFELRTGSKRHWLIGLGVGAALGLVLGATAEVNEATCNYDWSTDFCSRGEAVAGSVAVLGGAGAIVGALVKTDRWTPVALDALGPPASRTSGLAPQIRVLQGGGVGLALSVGF
jgi:hypothetical protein